MSGTMSTSFIFIQLLSVPLALVYANVMEWLIHKHLLHGVGKRKASFFSFHWHEHHRQARRNDMFDAQYVRPLLTWSPQGKEALSVAGLALAHGVLLRWLPVFTLTVWLCALRYYFVHKKAHLDPAWCLKHVPVHYDHHMGKDQNANWCVTSPWFDFVMGTRKIYSYDPRARPVGELPLPASWFDRFVASFWRAGEPAAKDADAMAGGAPDGV